MSVNKYLPHVWVIPEDDANRQLANGFVIHHDVDDSQIQVVAPAGGWRKALELFDAEYLPLLQKYTGAHIVLLIDFDEDDGRGDEVLQKVPQEVRSRVFVIGSIETPETLKRKLGKGLEAIGGELASECHSGTLNLWQDPQLAHNSSELDRLLDVVKPLVIRLNQG